MCTIKMYALPALRYSESRRIWLFDTMLSGLFMFCHWLPLGERKTSYLEDISILTGGTLVKDELGVTLDKADESVLGVAAKVRWSLLNGKAATFYYYHRTTTATQQFDIGITLGEFG